MNALLADCRTLTNEYSRLRDILEFTFIISLSLFFSYEEDEEFVDFEAGVRRIFDPYYSLEIGKFFSSKASKPINIRWIGTGFTEISCIVSNYNQFFVNIKIKIIILKPVLLASVFGISGLPKLILIL